MNMKTPAGTTTTTIGSVVCPRCGTIAKSGKNSCCGRGGSWFKTCGGTGTKKNHHTWYEGIKVCKVRSQSKTAVGQQLNAAQQEDIDSSQGADMGNYKEVSATAKTFTFTPVNTSTPMSDTTSIVTSTYTSDNVLITTSAHTLMTDMLTDTFTTSSTHTSVSTSITTQGCAKLLKITMFISIFCL